MLKQQEQKNSVCVETVCVLDGSGAPFLNLGDTVRICSMAMAGSTSKLEIEGSAKLVRRTSIDRLIGGQRPMGAQEEEFEIELTGKGKVVISLSVQSPTSGFPEVTEHVIAVS